MKNIVGHQDIVKNLTAAIENGSPSHAYLFSGSKGLGKFTLAYSFTKSLLCLEGTGCSGCKNCQFMERKSHPDVLVISGQDSIKIEETRKIKDFLSLTPYLAKRKVVIIKNIERFTREASNSLLKILEEPDGNSIFILTAENTGGIMSTIVSRCQIVPFKFVPVQEIEDWVYSSNGSKDESREVARKSLGKPGRAFELLNQKENYPNIFLRSTLFDKFQSVSGIVEKTDLNKFLDYLTLCYRDILLIKTGNFDKINNLKGKEELSEMAERCSFLRVKEILGLILKIQENLGTGVNTKLMMENLILKTEV